MRTLLATLLSPGVPLIGIALVGVLLGGRHAAEVAGFVWAWEIVLYPLTALIVLAALLIGRKLGRCGLRRSAVAGLVVGLALTSIFVFFMRSNAEEPWSSADTAFAEIALAAGCVFGAATGATAWVLALKPWPA